MDARQEEMWKQESKQLKDDLSRRPKHVIKREVEVRLPGVPLKPSKQQRVSSQNSDKAAALLRHQLGI